MGGACSYCPCCRPKPKIYSQPEPSPRTPEPPSTQPEPPSRNIQLPERAKVPRQPQVSSGSPFANSGVSKTNPLDLIKGYENELLGSLENALTPFYGKIGHLSDYVKEAKKKCHYPSEHGLTRDESAAIYIYTKKWENGCLYDHLQAAWESNDKSKMKPWFKFLKLFKTAYNKLPGAKDEMWKGKWFDPRLNEELDSASASFYAAMDMFSPSKATIEQSFDDDGFNKKMLIGLQGVGAKEAHDYVANDYYSILVFPGMRVAVFMREEIKDNNSVTYHLNKLSGTYYYRLTSFPIILYIVDILFVFNS